MTNSRRSARLMLVLTATTATAASAAVLAVASDAQQTTQTLHLVGTKTKSGFFPQHRPVAGDRVGFAERLSGDATGVDRVTCTIVVKGESLCIGEFVLPTGTISVQGRIAERDTSHPISITGGTGAYAGAGGVATIGVDSSGKTPIELSLR